MTRLGTATLAGVALLVTAAAAPPARGADPLAAGAEIRADVLEEVAPVAEWQLGGRAVAFGRSEVRRIGDFAHVRVEVTRADGGPIDPETTPWIGEAARPPVFSGALRLRAGRWLVLDVTAERADGADPEARLRNWSLPAGLLPPDCEHRQNWGCGGPAR